MERELVDSGQWTPGPVLSAKFPGVFIRLVASILHLKGNPPLWQVGVILFFLVTDLGNVLFLKKMPYLG